MRVDSMNSDSKEGVDMEVGDTSNNWPVDKDDIAAVNVGPGKPRPPGSKNADFYMNRIPCLPDHKYIDDIHKDWYGNYQVLEYHHGYIQWLFPNREPGLNSQAHVLTDTDIEQIYSNAQARGRIITSYKMMLDFYGMELVSMETGEIQRSKNWKNQFNHLNGSMHNYLRITRILKFLGEFDYENFKISFIQFVLREAIEKRTLTRTLTSCQQYWIDTVADQEVQQQLRDIVKEPKTKKKVSKHVPGYTLP